MRSRRFAALILCVLLLAAPIAQATSFYCYWTVLFWTYDPVYGIPMPWLQYICVEVIDVNGQDPGPEPSPGGVLPPPGINPPPPQPTPGLMFPPSVSIAYVDTTNTNSLAVVADVSSNYNNPAVVVEFKVNGTIVDSATAYHDGRFTFHLGSPNQYNVTTTFAVAACTASEQCGESSGTMTRYEQQPLSAHTVMSASWLEADEERPIVENALYDHTFAQSYRRTAFSVAEVGQNTRDELTGATVTIGRAAADPQPLFQAVVNTHGTQYNSSYNTGFFMGRFLCDQCSSQDAYDHDFGYLPSVDDNIFRFVVKAVGAVITNQNLSLQCQ